VVCGGAAPGVAFFCLCFVSPSLSYCPPRSTLLAFSFFKKKMVAFANELKAACICHNEDAMAAVE
jgi:hypothetical protein